MLQARLDEIEGKLLPEATKAAKDAHAAWTTCKDKVAALLPRSDGAQDAKKALNKVMSTANKALAALQKEAQAASASIQARLRSGIVLVLDSGHGCACNECACNECSEDAWCHAIEWRPGGSRAEVGARVQKGVQRQDAALCEGRPGVAVCWPV